MCAQSCPALCDPVDCSPPGFSVHGILQVRILEWEAISFSRGSSNPGIKSVSPALAGEFFTTRALVGKPDQGEQRHSMNTWRTCFYQIPTYYKGLQIKALCHLVRKRQKDQNREAKIALCIYEYLACDREDPRSLGRGVFYKGC